MLVGALDREPEGLGAVVGVFRHLLPRLLVKHQGYQTRHLDLQLADLRHVANLYLTIYFALAATGALGRPR